MSSKGSKNNRSHAGMRPLAYALKPITTKAFNGKTALFGKLLLDWPTITKGMGCEGATPTKLTFPRGKNSGATLSLAASSSLAFTLQHATTQILQQINQFFGYNAVEKINFIHQAPPPNLKKKNKETKKVSAENIEKLEKQLDFVENDEIKKALVALGKSVIHKGQADSQSIKKDKNQ